MKIRKIRPVGKALLVRLHVAAKVGGLFLPEKYSGQRGKAEVVAVGALVKRCKPGDYVILGPDGTVMDADPSDRSIVLVTDDAAVLAVVEYEPESSIVVPTTLQ